MWARPRLPYLEQRGPSDSGKCPVRYLPELPEWQLLPSGGIPAAALPDPGALMSTAPPPIGKLHLVAGYDGSAPAVRALDAAVSLLRDRDGSIEVIYVSHLTAAEMMS